MSRLLFDLPHPAVPVIGDDSLYPVRRIFCVARNYAAHAREMGADPARESPFYFTKPACAVVAGGGAIPYPPATADLHHEIELVVALGAHIHQASPAEAESALFGCAVGLDLTRRDLQATARKAGHPWDLAKAFEYSAPVSPLVRTVPATGAITLAVNGTPRQSGDLTDMIWSVPEVIADLSRYYHLGPGDLIFTGTPEGVGPVVPGDRLAGRIDGVGELLAHIIDSEDFPLRIGSL